MVGKPLERWEMLNHEVSLIFQDSTCEQTSPSRTINDGRDFMSGEHGGHIFHRKSPECCSNQFWATYAWRLEALLCRINSTWLSYLSRFPCIGVNSNEAIQCSSHWSVTCLRRPAHLVHISRNYRTTTNLYSALTTKVHTLKDSVFNPSPTISPGHATVCQISRPQLATSQTQVIRC